jgi:hypothetical protein
MDWLFPANVVRAVASHLFLHFVVETDEGFLSRW